MEGTARIASEPETRDLIGRLQRNEAGAYEEFMSTFGPGLLRFGKRMCGDPEDAREVLQDTLLKTFTSIGTLKEPAAFKTWLFRILANACLMRRRKSQYLGEEIPLDEALPDRGSLEAPRPWAELPDRVLQNAELRKALEDAILSLPADYRLVILMRDVEGLSTEETAEALGVSRDVAKMRLHRARARLRNLLEPRLGGN
jgi:RNA polymerase sigma-70 factor (ECF subfamily)